MLPALLKSYENNKTDAADKSLEASMKLLSAWDKNTSATSVATTLAIEWGDKIWPTILRGSGANDASGQVEKTYQFAASASGQA